MVVLLAFNAIAWAYPPDSATGKSAYSLAVNTPFSPMDPGRDIGHIRLGLGMVVGYFAEYGAQALKINNDAATLLKSNLHRLYSSLPGNPPIEILSAKISTTREDGTLVTVKLTTTADGKSKEDVRSFYVKHGATEEDRERVLDSVLNVTNPEDVHGGIDKTVGASPEAEDSTRYSGVSDEQAPGIIEVLLNWIRSWFGLSLDSKIDELENAIMENLKKARLWREGWFDPLKEIDDDRRAYYRFLSIIDKLGQYGMGLSDIAMLNDPAKIRRIIEAEDLDTKIAFLKGNGIQKSLSRGLALKIEEGAKPDTLVREGLSLKPEYLCDWTLSKLLGQAALLQKYGVPIRDDTLKYTIGDIMRYHCFAISHSGKNKEIVRLSGEQLIKLHRDTAPNITFTLFLVKMKLKRSFMPQLLGMKADMDTEEVEFLRAAREIISIVNSGELTGESVERLSSLRESLRGNSAYWEMCSLFGKDHDGCIRAIAGGSERLSDKNSCYRASVALQIFFKEMEPSASRLLTSWERRETQVLAWIFRNMPFLTGIFWREEGRPNGDTVNFIATPALRIVTVSLAIIVVTAALISFTSLPALASPPVIEPVDLYNGVSPAIGSGSTSGLFTTVGTEPIVLPVNTETRDISSLSLSVLAKTLPAQIGHDLALAINVVSKGNVIERGPASHGHVLEIQIFLYKAGLYKGKLDGVYGYATEKAVADYQRAYNANYGKSIHVTGKVDAETVKAIIVSSTNPDNGFYPDNLLSRAHDQMNGPVKTPPSPSAILSPVIDSVLRVAFEYSPQHILTFLKVQEHLITQDPGKVIMELTKLLENPAVRTNKELIGMIGILRVRAEDEMKRVDNEKNKSADHALLLNLARSIAIDVNPMDYVDANQNLSKCLEDYIKAINDSIVRHSGPSGRYEKDKRVEGVISRGKKVIEIYHIASCSGSWDSDETRRSMAEAALDYISSVFNLENVNDHEKIKEYLERLKPVIYVTREVNGRVYPNVFQPCPQMKGASERLWDIQSRMRKVREGVSNNLSRAIELMPKKDKTAVEMAELEQCLREVLSNDPGNILAVDYLRLINGMRNAGGARIPSAAPGVIKIPKKGSLLMDPITGQLWGNYGQGWVAASYGTTGNFVKELLKAITGAAKQIKYEEYRAIVHNEVLRTGKGAIILIPKKDVRGKYPAIVLEVDVKGTEFSPSKDLKKVIDSAQVPLRVRIGNVAVSCKIKFTHLGSLDKLIKGGNIGRYWKGNVFLVDWNVSARGNAVGEGKYDEIQLGPISPGSLPRSELLKGSYAVYRWLQGSDSRRYASRMRYIVEALAVQGYSLNGDIAIAPLAQEQAEEIDRDPSRIFQEIQGIKIGDVPDAGQFKRAYILHLILERVRTYPDSYSNAQLQRKIVSELEKSARYMYERGRPYRGLSEGRRNTIYVQSFIPRILGWFLGPYYKEPAQCLAGIFDAFYYAKQDKKVRDHIKANGRIYDRRGGWTLPVNVPEHMANLNDSIRHSNDVYTKANMSKEDVINVFVNIWGMHPEDKIIAEWQGRSSQELLAFILDPAKMAGYMIDRPDGQVYSVEVVRAGRLYRALKGKLDSVTSTYTAYTRVQDRIGNNYVMVADVFSLDGRLLRTMAMYMGKKDPATGSSSPEDKVWCYLDSEGDWYNVTAVEDLGGGARRFSVEKPLQNLRQQRRVQTTVVSSKGETVTTEETVVMRDPEGAIKNTSGEIVAYIVPGQSRIVIDLHAAEQAYNVSGPAAASNAIKARQIFAEIMRNAGIEITGNEADIFAKCAVGSASQSERAELEKFINSLDSLGITLRGREIREFVLKVTREVKPDAFSRIHSPGFWDEYMKVDRKAFYRTYNMRFEFGDPKEAARTHGKPGAKEDNPGVAPTPVPTATSTPASIVTPTPVSTITPEPVPTVESTGGPAVTPTPSEMVPPVPETPKIEPATGISPDNVEDEKSPVSGASMGMAGICTAISAFARSRYQALNLINHIDNRMRVDYEVSHELIESGNRQWNLDLLAYLILLHRNKPNIHFILEDQSDWRDVCAKIIEGAENKSIISAKDADGNDIGIDEFVRKNVSTAHRDGVLRLSMVSSEWLKSTQRLEKGQFVIGVENDRGSDGFIDLPNAFRLASLYLQLIGLIGEDNIKALMGGRTINIEAVDKIKLRSIFDSFCEFYSSIGEGRRVEDPRGLQFENFLSNILDQSGQIAIAIALALPLIRAYGYEALKQRYEFIREVLESL